MPSLEIASHGGAAASIPEEELAGLKMSLRGPLLQPGDAGYADVHVYNGMFDGLRPALIVRARGTADVIDAVNFAREHDLILAIRGGGHSIAGKSTCDGGLMLDLSLMTGVHVDRKGMTVRVQGGATWGDVDRETQQFGLAAPGGVVSNTGVAGLTLNGGIGHLRSKYGLSCDNLVSAEVVTAAGELINASATENADLFWALRGGGGNFGVVTSFEFRLHPVGPMVAAAIPIYALDDAEAVLKGWAAWTATAPDEVSTNAIFWTIPASEHMPPPLHGKQVLIVAGVYCGDPATGEGVLQGLKTLATPIFDMSGVMPFRFLQAAFDFFFPVTGEVSGYWKSTYVNEMSAGVIDVLAAAARTRTSPMTMINIPHMGPGVRNVAPEATAFGERKAPFMISLDSNWTEGSAAEHIGWARSTWEHLQTFSTGAVYLNFLGEEERDADSVVRKAFGPNYERLVDVKTKYDPTNLFRLNQNIKPRG